MAATVHYLSKMFGFLGTPCRSCASTDTHSVYRSFYCGLSGALRDDYLPAARFLVNRDATFLSILGASLSPSEPERTLRTCCNPLSVPKPLFSEGIHTRFAAAVTICGLATKLEDDCADESGLRRMGSKLLGQTIRPMTDRAISFLNTIRFPTAEVSDLLARQSAIEANKPDLIEAASPTADAYGIIFREIARISGATQQKNSLRLIGQNLGRLIYWRDAWDDREADKARGRFNPLEKAEPEELPDRFGHAMTQLRKASRLSGHFAGTIQEILATTLIRHQELIPSTMMAEAEVGQSKKKIEHEKENPCTKCCDTLSCCSFDLCCCEGISCGT